MHIDCCYAGRCRTVCSQRLNERFKRLLLAFQMNLDAGFIVQHGAFRVEAPFRFLSKEEVVRRAGDLPWRLTFSCLSPRGLSPCGRCNKCEERRKALIFRYSV